MTTVLIAPVGDRLRVQRVVARLDQILGYPRTHSIGEPGVRVATGRLPPRTESSCAVLLHSDGRVAVVISDETRAEVAERIIDDGQGARKKLRTWIQDQGWQVATSLPDQPSSVDMPSPWTVLPVRDGAAGSADGVPIPEGAE